MSEFLTSNHSLFFFKVNIIAYTLQSNLDDNQILTFFFLARTPHSSTTNKMAAAAAIPLAPSFNLYSPRKFVNGKTSRFKLKVNDNLNRKPVSCLPASVSWPVTSVEGSRTLRASRIVSRAYVSAPAFDAIVPEVDPKIDGAEIVELQPLDVISWGLLWRLVSRHKWRVLASVLTLVGCTSCTLAMPLFSGMSELYVLGGL